jgi:hypothetical protein
MLSGFFYDALAIISLALLADEELVGLFLCHRRVVHPIDIPRPVNGDE